MRLIKVLLTVAIAVAVVSAGVLVLVLLMRGRVGENAVAALPPPALSVAPPVTLPSVLLLRAEATARYIATLPGSAPDAYDRRVDGWRRRLEAAGVRVQVIDEAALAARPLGTDAVLVAPSAAALDDGTVTRILTAVEGGTGLIATWAFALYDADGAWRGYGPLARLAGLQPMADAPAEPPRFVALHGQTSVTVGLPAGARLEIQPYDRPLALTTQAAVADYVDWAMLSLGPAEAPFHQTAVARARCGAGRVVWLNFEPAALVGGGVGPDRLARLVQNALVWAGGTALGDLETWPGGARAAAAIGLDAEHQFDQGQEIAHRLADVAVPFTSFVLTMLAPGHAAVLSALAEAGEIASHTHDHRALSDQSEDEQRQQLVQSRALLTNMTGRTVVGLRPPEEQTNAATLSALANTGYHYVVGWREKDQAEPWVMQANGKAVVVLPRIPRDDFEYAVRRANQDPATAWASMRADLQQVRRLGGFYFFDFHTQFWALPAIRQGVEHLTGLRNLPGVWLATVGDVAAWWRTRSRAAVRVDTAADGTITVELAAGTVAPALGVAVYLPDDPGSYVAEAVRGAPPTAVVVGGPDGVLRLEYRDLDAGERRLTRLIPSRPLRRS